MDQQTTCAHCGSGGELKAYAGYWDADSERMLHPECSKAYKQGEAYECQKIDCNCNDCAFMERDFETYNRFKDAARETALEDFTREKEKAIDDAMQIEDERGRQGALRQAKKMEFQFSPNILSYGKCQKFDKQVSFIPKVCQLETQECFVHRKDA